MLRGLSACGPLLLIAGEQFHDQLMRPVSHRKIEQYRFRRVREATRTLQLVYTGSHLLCCSTVTQREYLGRDALVSK